MSLLPYILDELIPQNYIQHHMDLRPGDFWNAATECPFIRNTAGFRRSANSNVDQLEKQEKIGKDGFQVCLDVQHFKPNEISVKTVDNSIIIEASHEEREDSHGYIKRQFKRRYDLPEGFKAKDVVSTISSDGILSIKCPKNEAIEGNVRHIQIQQTGPARLNLAKEEEKAVKEAPKGK